MNHVKQITSTPQFTDLPLDVSTIPRRVISSAQTHTHTHTNPSTSTITSENKDASRCFYDSEPYYTASVLHKKETDTGMAR